MNTRKIILSTVVIAAFSMSTLSFAMEVQKEQIEKKDEEELKVRALARDEIKKAKEQEASEKIKEDLVGQKQMSDSHASVAKCMLFVVLPITSLIFICMKYYHDI